MSQQKVVPILEGESYDNSADAIKSKETKATYDFRLRQFLVYLNMQRVDELFKSMDHTTAEKKIIEYIKYLKKEKELSYSSLQVVIASLKNIYVMNDVVLNWDKIRRYLGEHEKTVEDKAYSHEQIKKLLQFANLRAMVTILLLASSGMRRGALPGLKSKHLTYIEKYGLYRITTYPKAKERYVTFCTPECATAIDKYFDYRRGCGEVIGDESPVIRDTFDRRNKDKAINPKPVSNDGFKFMLEGVVTKAELKMKHEVKEDGKISKRTQVMIVHGFRKFFDTNLRRARLHINMINRLMGHKGGLQGNYDTPEDEELLEEYLKAIPLLTINDENRLKAKIVTLEDKDRETQDLRKQLEESKKETRTMKEQIAKMEDSQLRIMELLNNPAMIKYIRANPQEYLAASNAIDDKFSQRDYDNEVEKLKKGEKVPRIKRITDSDGKPL
jgi:integrase